MDQVSWRAETPTPDGREYAVTEQKTTPLMMPATVAVKMIWDDIHSCMSSPRGRNCICLSPLGDGMGESIFVYVKGEREFQTLRGPGLLEFAGFSIPNPGSGYQHVLVASMVWSQNSRDFSDVLQICRWTNSIYIPLHL
jgi:hypothetical protein